MRTLLKLAGVPKTNETISAASRPKFTILWGHVEEILLLNKFFFRLSIHALARAIWQFWTAASLGHVFRTASQCEKFLLILRIGRNEFMDLWISETYEHSTKVSV